MHILVINPNTTASMTQKIGAAAQAAAAPGTTIEAVNPAFGPPSIEGYYDEVFSIPGLLAPMRAATRRRNATGHEGQILKIGPPLAFSSKDAKLFFARTRC
jgi:Asp/Glu/hydantoin racemase